jgi:hypothetical protein
MHLSIGWEGSYGLDVGDRSPSMVVYSVSFERKANISDIFT